MKYINKIKTQSLWHLYSITEKIEDWGQPTLNPAYWGATSPALFYDDFYTKRMVGLTDINKIEQLYISWNKLCIQRWYTLYSG